MVYVSANKKAVSLNLHRYTEAQRCLAAAREARDGNLVSAAAVRFQSL
jgi:hypothetical protein